MIAPAAIRPFRRKALAQVLALCFVLTICLFAARPFLNAFDQGQVHLAWLMIIMMIMSLSQTCTYDTEARKSGINE